MLPRIQVLLNSFKFIQLLIICLFVIGCRNATNADQVEAIYDTENILSYSYYDISPNNEMILINEWVHNKDTHSFIQKIIIIDLITGKNISKLPDNFSLVEQNSICWDKESKNVYFTAASKYDVIYKWNIKTNEILEVLQGDNVISLLAISPTNEYLSFIEDSTDGTSKLKIYALNTGNEEFVDIEVDDIRSLWINDHTLLYSKNGSIYSYNCLNDYIKKLLDTHLTVNNIKIISDNKIVIISSKINALNYQNQVDLLKQRVNSDLKIVKDIWIYNLKTNKQKKLFSFETLSPGLAIDETSIVIPISINDYKSCLFLYDFNQIHLRKLITCSEKDDLPIFIKKRQGLLFRRNNKEIHIYTGE